MSGNNIPQECNYISLVMELKCFPDLLKFTGMIYVPSQKPKNTTQLFHKILSQLKATGCVVNPTKCNWGFLETSWSLAHHKWSQTMEVFTNVILKNEYSSKINEIFGFLDVSNTYTLIQPKWESLHERKPFLNLGWKCQILFFWLKAQQRSMITKRQTSLDCGLWAVLFLCLRG